MKYFLNKLCSVLALVALVAVQPACVWWWHQPEVPKALRK
ncbi:MAG: cyclic lactone autoinducer peptide [Syntrophomonadaceae bacterium]|nr:cyclic lactone autoinducer peptide [Syntrophomonadaceae bacterium]HAF17751.1 cyclic lactone autoinducer peptide [Peptococcaceae bacterium]